jgi:hypothetical protein
MRKVIATLLMIVLGTPVWSGEVDGKGIWCENEVGYFFKNDSFEAYVQDDFDVDDDGDFTEHYPVFTQDDTSYRTHKDSVIMCIESQGCDSGIMLDRIKIHIRFFGCRSDCPDKIEYIKCEVLENESEFKKRLKQEEETARNSKKKRKI